jgi:AraC-like DNA-binding protein/mannose-6-phosphate isomerase-like protein (cupin superfamily)
LPILLTFFDMVFKIRRESMKKEYLLGLRKEFSHNVCSVLAEIEQYNEDELFYKRCFELRQNQKALKEYIASFDEKALENRDLNLPTKKKRTELTESYIFGSAQKQNVLLRKHNRYTPAFEHYHDYFEVFYVLSGKCVNTIGTERFTLSAGSLCFIAPFINHTLEVFDSSIVINICIRKTTFDEIFFNLLTSHDFLAGFFIGNLYPVDPMEYIVFDIGADSELIENIFTMLIEQFRHDTHSDRIMDNLVSIFFTLVVRKKVKGQLFIGQVEQHRYISYINENFRTITLADIAKHFNVSIAHCSRHIKTLTGKKFTELVRDIRLRHAQSMLTSSNVKISDISYSLGYNNQETFIRSFKKIYGFSPGQYRNGTTFR